MSWCNCSSSIATLNSLQHISLPPFFLFFQLTKIWFKAVSTSKIHYEVDKMNIALGVLLIAINQVASTAYEQSNKINVNYWKHTFHLGCEKKLILNFMRIIGRNLNFLQSVKPINSRWRNIWHSLTSDILLSRESFQCSYVKINTDGFEATWLVLTKIWRFKPCIFSK